VFHLSSPSGARHKALKLPDAVKADTASYFLRGRYCREVSSIGPGGRLRSDSETTTTAKRRTVSSYNNLSYAFVNAHKRTNERTKEWNTKMKTRQIKFTMPSNRVSSKNKILSKGKSGENKFQPGSKEYRTCQVDSVE